MNTNQNYLERFTNYKRDYIDGTKQDTQKIKFGLEK